MKKIMSLLLVMVVSTLILTGCKTTTTTKSTTGTSTGASTNSSGTTAPVSNFECPEFDKTKPVKVITHVADSPEYQYLVAGFEEACDADVIVEHVTWDEQKTKLKATVAARDTYDVALLFGEFYPSHITSQFLMPLDEIDNFDPTDELWDQDVLNTFKWDGKYYGAGTVYDKGPRLMFFNVDAIEDAGLDNPVELEEEGEWTWDAYKDMLEELQEKDETGTVTRWGGILGGWYHMLMQANGGDLVKINADGSTSFDMKDPAAVAAWQFEWDLTHTDKLIPVDGDAKQMFENKQVVISWEGSWYINSLAENENIDFDWDFVGFPQGPNVPEGEFYVPGEYSSWGVPNGASNPEGGMAWIMYTADPDNHLFPDTVRGTLYTDDESGQTERFEYYQEHVRRTNFHGIVVSAIWDFYWKAMKEGVDTLETALTSFEPTFRNLYNFAINPPQPEPAKPVTEVSLDFEGMTGTDMPAGWGAGWNTTYEYVTDGRAIEGTSLLMDFTGDWGGILQSDATQVKLPGWYEYTVSFDYKLLSTFDTTTDHRLIMKIASDTGDKLFENQIIGKWAGGEHENPTANEVHHYTVTFLVEKPVTDAKFLFQGSSANMPVMVIDNLEIDAEYKWYHIHPEQPTE